MLETALMRTSDAVTLDLLTLADLETLRQKRTADVRFQAATMRALTPQNLPHSGAAQTVSTQQKRYLILTYTAQFDRIHYPLPLAYTGRPNPRRMQEEIRTLKAELRRVNTNGISSTDVKTHGSSIVSSLYNSKLIANNHCCASQCSRRLVQRTWMWIDCGTRKPRWNER